MKTSRAVRLAVWRKYAWVGAASSPTAVDGWQWFSVALIKGGVVELPVWLVQIEGA